MAQDRENILPGQGPNGFRLVYCGAGFLPQLVETGYTVGQRRRKTRWRSLVDIGLGRLASWPWKNAQPPVTLSAEGWILPTPMAGADQESTANLIPILIHSQESRGTVAPSSATKWASAPERMWQRLTEATISYT